MPISIHAIRAAEINAAPFIDVPVEGWGDVRLKRLATPQFVKFMDSLQSSGKGGEATLQQMLELVCLTAVDDGGAPLFAEPADRELLASIPAVVMLLGSRAIDFNGLGQVESAAKKPVVSEKQPSHSLTLSGE